METIQQIISESWLQMEHWLHLLDQLNIGAFTIDINRRITAFNSNMQSLLGIEDVEAIGRDCREIFTGVPCLGKCPYRDASFPDTDYIDIQISDRQNSKHLITRMVTPVYNEKKMVIGCLTLFQDHSHFESLITKIHYEEQNMKLILDTLDMAVFTVNRSGYITFFNMAAERMTGLGRGRILGRSCSALFGNDGINDCELIRKTVSDGLIRANHETVIITHESGKIPVKASYTPLKSRSGKIIGCVVTIYDLRVAIQSSPASDEQYSFHGMIGREPCMQRIFERVKAVAKSDVTVLIEGDTGTGKDMLAKSIHSSGARAERALVKVNCAAIPDNLLESEMFGYIRGAFTGAFQDKIGRFQEADGGTIFLDEIGDLPVPLQAKLLRVIEEKEFYPLGSRQPVKVDVRIISATNRDLGRLASEGVFRYDLFYRLNVIRIELPPLKNRRSDIPLLISRILEKLTTSKSINPPQISRKAMDMLLDHDYPGNIRELENILEHALIINRSGLVEKEDLPDYLSQTGATDHKAISEIFDHDEELLEKEKLIQTLKIHNWHRGNTAAALGVERTTLWRKMKKFGLILQQ